MDENFDYIINVEKGQFYGDIAEYLLQSQNKDGGWYTEKNKLQSSCLNTSESLLGLIFSLSTITHSTLSKKISKSITSGINFLFAHQLKSGGWTSSKYNNDKTAKGNIIYTSMATWAILEYSVLHSNRKKERKYMERALSFFNSCKITQKDFCYCPKYKNTSDLATIYALLGYANLYVFFNELIGDLKLSSIIKKEISNILSNFKMTPEKTFENILFLLVLKKIKIANIITQSLISDQIKLCENIVQNISLNIFSDDSYRYPVFIDEINESEKYDFPYWVPIWTLSALSYGYATEASYRNKLITYILQSYCRVNNKKIEIVRGDRTTTWASAQTLMAFSMYSTTSKLYEFFNIDSNYENKGKVFIVYGRDKIFTDCIKNLILRLGLQPIVYNNNLADSTSTFAAMAEKMRSTDVTIVALTGDDEARLRTLYSTPTDTTEHYNEYKPQPRMNVLFEAGYSYGMRNNSKTILIKPSNVRLPSDLYGFNVIELNISENNTIDTVASASFKKNLCESLIRCGYTFTNEQISEFNDCIIRLNGYN